MPIGDDASAPGLKNRTVHNAGAGRRLRTIAAGQREREIWGKRERGGGREQAEEGRKGERDREGVVFCPRKPIF